MKHAALFVLVAACGGSHAKPDAAAPPRCDPSAPFNAPVAIAELDTAGDEVGARLTPDELVVVFARASSPGAFDLYTASRATADDPFGSPVPLGPINSVYSDSYPTLSPDQTIVFLDSDRTTGAQHVYASVRASPDDTFAPPSPAVALMDGEDHPLLANGNALYFASSVRAGMGMHDIWRADVDQTGATGTPAEVPGDIDTTDDEDFPAVSSDELAIYFVRTTADGTGVYQASRASADAGFGTPTQIPNLAPTGTAIAPSWVSPDQCHLYFDGTISGGPGGADIYMASR